jgi:hypothetical protein
LTRRSALAETFDEGGREAVRRVRDEDPKTYARVYAGVIPKETTPSDIYSDDQMEMPGASSPYGGSFPLHANS